MQKRKTRGRRSITYQNKDVVSKIFGENLMNKSLAVYGVNLPKIKAVMPTNLPAIEANELRIDNLFRLEDDSLALIDYESRYKAENKIKYLNYVVRTVKKEHLYRNTDQVLRVIIIYTGDITREETKAELDVGCLQFNVEEIFLSELDAIAIEQNLTKKINAGEELSDEEQMEFIILPLVYRTKEEKQTCIWRCFELGKKIPCQELQVFLLSGLLVFTDKVIEREESEKIRRWIMMTKVGRLFEEEKIAYGEKLVAEALEQQERKEKQSLMEIAKKMMKRGMSTAEIQGCITNLTYEEIERLNA